MLPCRMPWRSWGWTGTACPWRFWSGQEADFSASAAPRQKSRSPMKCLTRPPRPSRRRPFLPPRKKRPPKRSPSRRCPRPRPPPWRRRPPLPPKQRKQPPRRPLQRGRPWTMRPAFAPSSQAFWSRWGWKPPSPWAPGRRTASPSPWTGPNWAPSSATGGKLWTPSSS